MLKSEEPSNRNTEKNLKQTHGDEKTNGSHKLSCMSLCKNYKMQIFRDKDKINKSRLLF